MRRSADSSLNTICSTPSEKAAVASARYRPRSRSAGNAITAPTNAVVTIAITKATSPGPAVGVVPDVMEQHDAADAGERHRGQADLARVADQEHQRRDDDRGRDRVAERDERRGRHDARQADR